MNKDLSVFQRFWHTHSSEIQNNALTRTNRGERKRIKVRKNRRITKDGRKGWKTDITEVHRLRSALVQIQILLSLNIESFFYITIFILDLYCVFYKMYKFEPRFYADVNVASK